MTGNDVTSPNVTASDPEVTPFARSHLEVAVESRKLGFCVHLSSSRAVTRRRWHYVTAKDLA